MVEPVGQETEILGVSVTAMQEDDVAVAIDDQDEDVFVVTGTISYLTTFPEYSTEPTEQEGNFLALNFDFAPVVSDISLKHVYDELLDLPDKNVSIDDDNNAIFRIESVDDIIEVTLAVGEQSHVYTIDLSALVLTAL